MRKKRRIEPKETYTELTLELPLIYPEEDPSRKPKEEEKSDRGVIIIDLM